MQFGVHATGKDIATISRELRKTADGKMLRKQLSKDLRKAVAPLLPAVRASIGNIPTTGGKSTGLRARMQKATRLSVITAGKSASVSILVDPKKMPDGEKALPAYMEGTKGRWRHPVYGHDVWVTQDSHPFFYKIVRPAGVAARVAVQRAVNTVTKSIT
jgi:hypothetical protein